MSARALTQLVVVVLAIAALALAAVLLLRDPGGRIEPGGADAGSCDSSKAPPPLSPTTQDTLLLGFVEGSAKLTLDGKVLISLPEDPTRFPSGAHTLLVECGRDRNEQAIELKPFSPATVYASCADLYVFGALCDGCLAEDAQRKAAAKAGPASLLYAASTTQQKVDTAERTRAATMLTNRWNALTERYSRVLAAVGREAPGAVAKANLRFEELSAGFTAAANRRDPAAQDQLIRAAEETLGAFVKAARNARPADCEFQKRLTGSF